MQGPSIREEEAIGDEESMDETEENDVMEERRVLDVVSELFRWELEQLLVQVFLSLDLPSLRAAKQVGY